EVRVSMADADDAVKLGMTATVIVGQKLDARSFIIPMSALGGSKEQPAVWIVSDGKTHQVPVQVLRYTETGAVVSGALDAAMNMVSAGIHLMHEGMDVSVLQRQHNG
ncbi:MAG TPA: hypothetical protein VHE37_10305, partial [Nevskiaceae bacterium]|nr:hypothetical protein [Nevskiaceae bacterium]